MVIFRASVEHPKFISRNEYTVQHEHFITGMGPPFIGGVDENIAPELLEVRGRCDYNSY